MNEKRLLKAFREQKAWSNAVLSVIESRINRCEISIEQERYQFKVQVESLKRDVEKLEARDNNRGDQFAACQGDIDALKLNVSLLSKDNNKLLATVEYLNTTIEDIRLETDKLQVKENQIDCPDGWLNFTTNCYMFEDTHMSYKKAKAFCHSKGAHLVDIQSEQENTFVSQFSNGKKMWIGLTDEDTEGQWIWDRTGEIATYTNWRPGQPNNIAGTQHFAIMGESTPSEQWDDVYESYSSRVLCKM